MSRIRPLVSRKRIESAIDPWYLFAPVEGANVNVPEPRRINAQIDELLLRQHDRNLPRWCGTGPTSAFECKVSVVLAVSRSVTLTGSNSYLPAVIEPLQRRNARSDERALMKAEGFILSGIVMPSMASTSQPALSPATMNGRFSKISIGMSRTVTERQDDSY